MLSIYNYMASGVLLSGIVALCFRLEAAGLRCSTPRRLRWVVGAVRPLAIVFAMSFGANQHSDRHAARRCSGALRC